MMLNFKKTILLSLMSFMVLIVANASVVYAKPNFPTLSERVVDDANILTYDIKAGLISDLKVLEDAKQIQIAVAIVNSLEGYEIRDYGVQLARHWALGQAGKNNGVLLLVAPNERKVSIEVGYGLEGNLTDALSFLIIQQEILPKFKQGKMGAGVKAGVTAIISAVNGDIGEQNFVSDQAETELDIGEVIFLMFFFGVVIFILISAFRNGGTGGGGGSGYSSNNSNRSSWSSSSSSSSFSGGGGSFGGGGSSGGW